MAAESACAGQTVAAVVGKIVVAVMVVGDVQAFGGDSSPARGMQAFHSRRTRSRRLQGLGSGNRCNSWIMQVAGIKTVMLVRCNVNMLCEGNE